MINIGLSDSCFMSFMLENDISARCCLHKIHWSRVDQIMECVVNFWGDFID